MNDISAELASTPALYAQKYDAGRDAVYFIRLDEAAYRAASFLDDRVLAPGMQGSWTPFATVEQAMAGAGRSVPLHFIFHTGHVGSTLLSRLIDEAGSVLGLREPLPLRTLAEEFDRPGPHLDARLETFLKLWRRGFPATRAVVLKATSSSGRLAPRLLAASGESKAIYLNLKAEPYLATLLAGANALVDLKGFEQERAARLRALLDAATWNATSIGELAAMSWLTESLTQARALEAFGSRILALDFEQLLSNLAPTLSRVLAHFSLAAPPGFDTAISRSPVLTRYSKAPQQFAYSPTMRAQLLAQARAEHGGEIRKGLKFLEQLGAQHRSVAALL